MYMYLLIKNCCPTCKTENRTPLPASDAVKKRFALINRSFCSSKYRSNDPLPHRTALTGNVGQEVAGGVLWVHNLRSQ